MSSIVAICKAVRRGIRAERARPKGPPPPVPHHGAKYQVTGFHAVQPLEPFLRDAGVYSALMRTGKGRAR